MITLLIPTQNWLTQELIVYRRTTPKGELRAAHNTQLCNELWQAIVLPEDFNQQCLLPWQELEIDAQALFKGSLALSKGAATSTPRRARSLRS